MYIYIYNFFFELLITLLFREVYNLACFQRYEYNPYIQINMKIHVISRDDGQLIHENAGRSAKVSEKAEPLNAFELKPADYILGGVGLIRLRFICILRW